MDILMASFLFFATAMFVVGAFLAIFSDIYKADKAEGFRVQGIVGVTLLISGIVLLFTCLFTSLATTHDNRRPVHYQSVDNHDYWITPGKTSPGEEPVLTHDSSICDVCLEEKLDKSKESRAD